MEHADCLALLLNADIVKVNQDPAGLPPRLVWQHPPMSTPNVTSDAIQAQALARPLSGGRLAVLILNRHSRAANLTTTWAELGIRGSHTVFDVIGRRPAGSAVGTLTALVPSHDVCFVVLAPATAE